MALAGDVSRQPRGHRQRLVWRAAGPPGDHRGGQHRAAQRRGRPAAERCGHRRGGGAIHRQRHRLAGGRRRRDQRPAKPDECLRLEGRAGQPRARPGIVRSVPAAGVRLPRAAGGRPVGFWQCPVDRAGWGNRLVRGQADRRPRRLGHGWVAGSAGLDAGFVCRVAIDLRGDPRHRHGHAGHAGRDAGSDRPGRDTGSHRPGRDAAGSAPSTPTGSAPSTPTGARHRRRPRARHQRRPWARHRRRPTALRTARSRRSRPPRQRLL